MAVSGAAAKAADALSGGGPRTNPITSGAEYAAVKAVAAFTSPGGTPFFKETRVQSGPDQGKLTSVEMGTRGGDNGDVSTIWSNDTPGGTSGSYDGLQAR